MSSSHGAEAAQIIGRYELRRRLGAGAMGVVHAAYDPQLRREVALKLLSPTVDDARLRDEARAMAQVSSPSVVHVYEVGRHADQPFIAMELIDGVTLRAWFGAERRSWRDGLAVLVAVGEGLAAAHEAGVIHGDVKPDNVLVARNDRVCVGDFGLAATATDRKVYGGTPAYMAPEQHAGRPATAKSDQFSFAVTCWEVLYRERPFVGTSNELPTSLAVAAEIVSGHRRPPPAHISVPGFVRTTIARALSTDPDARWGSMRDLLAALAAGARRRRRASILVASGAAAVVASSIAVGATLWAHTRPDACELAGRSIDAVWNERQVSLIARAFATTRRPEAGRLAAAVRDKLDRWSESWSSARLAVCDGNASVAQRLQQEQCLDRRLDMLRARLGLLVDADGNVVDRALELATLPDPRTCGTPSGPARPQDPPSRGVLAALERDHDRIHAELLAARLDGIVGRARAVARAATAVGFAPAMSDAERLLASVAYYTSDVATAEPAIRRAITAAVESHDELRAARAWTDLVSMAGGARKTAALEEGILALRAALARIDDPAVQVEATAAIGIAQHRLGRADEAVETCKRAVARADKELQPDAMEYNQARRCLQLIYYELGRILDGLPFAEARAAWCERYYGANHPFTAEAITQQAELLSYLGRAVEALALQRRAVEITERVYGPLSLEAARKRTALADQLLTARGRNREGVALLEQAIPVFERLEPDGIYLPGSYTTLAETYGVDRLDDAVALYRKAIALFERMHGADRDKQVAIARSNLGDLLQRGHRCPAAIGELEAAVAGLGKVPGLAGWMTAGPLSGLAQCQAETGRTSEAIATLDRARALLADPSAQASLRVHVEAKLAELLWSSHRDRARAVKLLTSTCAMFEPMGPDQAKNLAECRGMLSEWRRALGAR